MRPPNVDRHRCECCGWGCPVNLLVMVSADQRLVNQLAGMVSEDVATVVLAQPDFSRLPGCVGGSPAFLLDGDLCYGRHQELTDAIRAAHPNAPVAFVVGWWDTRLADLTPLTPHFLRRPVRESELRLLWQVLSAATEPPPVSSPAPPDEAGLSRGADA